METFTKAQSFLDDQTKYTCDICDKNFTRETNLRSHFNRHKVPYKHPIETNKKKPLPSKANKGQVASNLEAQVAMDAKSWNKKCHICHLEFKRNQEKRIHMKTHTGLEWLRIGLRNFLFFCKVSPFLVLIFAVLADCLDLWYLGVIWANLESL